MKKALLRLYLICLSVCVLCFMFTACSVNGDSDTVDKNTNAVESSTVTTTPNKYTITWKNYDGTILEIDTNVEYGATPHYDGKTPTRTSDSQYEYTFSGWTPTLQTVEGNATYIAQFNQASNKYTITWKNYDGTILETDTNVEYGATPHYDGKTPTRISDSQYEYTFSGWTPTLQTVKGNTTYTAEHESKSLYDTFEVQDGWAIEKYNGNESHITIPSEINGKTIVEIADNAFIKNTKLLSITLPDTILRIGDGAFYRCSRLSEFKNSNNCQSVGRLCLAGTNIKEITIPESLISFGAFWTLLSPIEKIIIEGDRETTKFVGDYLGSVGYMIVSFYDGSNSLTDHFIEVRNDVQWKRVSIPGFGYNELPIKTEYNCILKDENRFFNYITDNYTAAIVGTTMLDTNKSIKVFANGSGDSYYYTISREYEYEYPDYGTWTFVYETVDSMNGNFYLSLDTLKTIEISSKSNINKSILLGRLETVTIQEYDN